MTKAKRSQPIKHKKSSVGRSLSAERSGVDDF